MGKKPVDKEIIISKKKKPRATLLNKESRSKISTKKKIEAVLKEFLKTSDKQKIISPLTDVEKGLVIEEPIIHLKTPKKIILPTLPSIEEPTKQTTPMTTKKKSAATATKKKTTATKKK